MVESKKMLKLFQCVQKYCGLIGIHLLHQNQSYFDYSKVIPIYLPIIFSLTSSFGFLLFKANSPQEYDVSFFMVISSAVTIAYFSVLTWKTPTINRMINQLEETIEKSEFFSSLKEKSDFSVQICCFSMTTKKIDSIN